MTVATTMNRPVSFRLRNKNPSHVSPMTPDRFIMDTNRAYETPSDPSELILAACVTRGRTKNMLTNPPTTDRRHSIKKMYSIL